MVTRRVVRLSVRSFGIAPALFLLLLTICFAPPVSAARQDPIEPDAPAAEYESDSMDPAAAGDLEISPDGVQILQQSLKQLGYFFGPADGRKGPRTRTALRNFQRDQSLPVTGSLDLATVERIREQVEIARPAPEPGEEPEAVPVVRPEPKPAAKSRSNPVVTVAKATGGAIKTGGEAVLTAGKATGSAGATAGKAIGEGGSATAKASVVAAKATATAAVVVAKSPIALYKVSKRAIVGESGSSDDRIRRSLEMRYAEDERLVPEEIDIRVSDGHVTLAFPHGARSDVTHAVRIARLTAGVESVTPIYVGSEIATPEPDLPPIVDPYADQEPAVVTDRETETGPPN